MAGDPRERYFRRLRRLRRAARRWSVIGAALVSATAVLLLYKGIGFPDVFWAAAAGGSIAMATWRWMDFRALRAQDPPPVTVAVDPVSRVIGLLCQHPAGKAAVDQFRRQRRRGQLQGTVVAAAADRLDRASATMAGLASRLSGPVESMATEAAAAEVLLWDAAQRSVGVEQARQFAPVDTHASLDAARSALLAQLEEGLDAYERLVAAAAAYVAEDGRSGMRNPTGLRLDEAAELLRAQAQGLAEARDLGQLRV